MDSTVRVDGDMTVLKIEWDPEIRSIEDSIMKNPMVAMLAQSPNKPVKKSLNKVLKLVETL